MLAMVMDKMISTIPDFLKMEGCEIIARRIYALRRAFKCADDWRQPQGAKASQWKPKVRWVVIPPASERPRINRAL